jgi:hypothetical protein
VCSVCGVYVWCVGVSLWCGVFVYVLCCVCVCVNNNQRLSTFAAIYCSAFSILLNDSIPTVDSNIKSIQYHNIPHNSDTNTT